MIKKVNKHWGNELWISDGTNTPYAFKKILFLAGKRTSLQVHKFKYETNYVFSGTGKLYISNKIFDIEKFLKEGMSYEEISNYELTFKIVELYENVVVDIPPGYVHRVVAETDLTFFEVSTNELDDVIRLQDDTNRSHGKIDYEHE